MKTIVLIDLISHDTMHIPFNEAYIDTVRQAYPEDEIVFMASQGHINNMDKKLIEKLGIKLQPVKTLRQRMGGKSLYGGLSVLKASVDCWDEIYNFIKNKNLRLASVLGAVGPLIWWFSRKFRRNFQGCLHFIQHDQFSLNWKSKNPITKWLSYRSVLGRGLPKKQKLIVLELGLEELVSATLPKLAGAIETIEHPVVTSEWREPLENLTPSVKVAFIGSCGKGKGFDTFLNLANSYASEQIEFHAIGRNSLGESGSSLFASLSTPPNNGYLSREKFVDLLEKMDYVCLPLPRKISHVSSGSIIDSITMLKPMLLLKDQSTSAMATKYGDFGLLADNKKILNDFFENQILKIQKEEYLHWVRSLRGIRQARSPEVLAIKLRTIVEDSTNTVT